MSARLCVWIPSLAVLGYVLNDVVSETSHSLVVFLDMNLPRTCTETFRRSYQKTPAKHEKSYAAGHLYLKLDASYSASVSNCS
jgi:hypothetical protein